MRERALREMGLAPSWVRRHAVRSGQADVSPAPLEHDTSHQEVALARRAPLRLDSLDLETLRLAIERCEACPRALGRSNAVAGEGTASARLMVVDHVPSRHEATTGALRDSDVARLFDQLLFAVGLKRDAIYLTHALRCDGAVPTQDETRRCAPYLQREIELLAPRALLALGHASAEAIRIHAQPTAARVFALAHPGELLKDAAKKRAAWATLRELRAYLAEG
jgi:uracil-DNA glycosylase family 4